MSAQLTKRPSGTIWLRWIARVVGLGLILLLGLFAVGEGLFPYLVANRLDPVELLLMVALALAVAGLVVALFKEGWGGLMALVGSAAFILVNSLATGGLRLGPFEIGLAVTGALFLVVAWQTRRSRPLF